MDKEGNGLSCSRRLVIQGCEFFNTKLSAHIITMEYARKFLIVTFILHSYAMVLKNHNISPGNRSDTVETAGSVGEMPQLTSDLIGEIAQYLGPLDFIHLGATSKLINDVVRHVNKHALPDPECLLAPWAIHATYNLVPDMKQLLKNVDHEDVIQMLMTL